MTWQSALGQASLTSAYRHLTPHTQPGTLYLASATCAVAIRSTKKKTPERQSR